MRQKIRVECLKTLDITTYGASLGYEYVSRVKYFEIQVDKSKSEKFTVRCPICQETLNITTFPIGEYPCKREIWLISSLLILDLILFFSGYIHGYFRIGPLQGILWFLSLALLLFFGWLLCEFLLDKFSYTIYITPEFHSAWDSTKDRSIRDPFFKYFAWS